MDTTGHGWLAKLSNYNFTCKFRNGKKNADAATLSKVHGSNNTTTVFPDVLKAICQKVMVEKDEEDFVDSLVAPDTVSPIVQSVADIVPDDLLSATALTT